MLETTTQIAGVGEGVFHLIAHFDNKDPEQVREMLQLLHHPDGIAEVESCDDDYVVLKDRPTSRGYNGHTRIDSKGL
jgi:hypothetical protein